MITTAKYPRIYFEKDMGKDRGFPCVVDKKGDVPGTAEALATLASQRIPGTNRWRCTLAFRGAN